MKLGFLRSLYEDFGGHVSVYLDTGRGEENAPEQIGLRWRPAAERLSADGTDEASLAAVEEVLNDPSRAAPGRAVFARAGQVTLTAPLSHPPHREIARIAPLPHLMPLLAQDPPPAASSPALEASTGHAMADREREECRRRFEEWPSQRRRGAGVDGLADVLAALRDGQVRDLFVLDGHSSVAIAWVGPRSADAGRSEAELRELGVEEPVPDRADAAIVRALAMTGARLHFLPEDFVPHAGELSPRDGICASLRYPP